MSETPTMSCQGLQHYIAISGSNPPTPTAVVLSKGDNSPISQESTAIHAHMCLILSGLSGSGKTTIGKSFVEGKPDWEFIDGDWFFLKGKPKVELSSGELVSNWDTSEAVDWEKLNAVISEKLKTKNVVLATFLPLISKYDKFSVDYHIRLDMGKKYVKRCIQARIVSKGTGEERDANGELTDKAKEWRRRDEMMVREVVIPMYHTTMKEQVDDTIEIYDGEQRKTLNVLVEEVRQSIEMKDKVFLEIAPALQLQTHQLEKLMSSRWDTPIVFHKSIFDPHTFYFCSVCLGEIECEICRGGEPDQIVVGTRNPSTLEWTYGEPFKRTDEYVHIYYDVD